MICDVLLPGSAGKADAGKTTRFLLDGMFGAC